MAKNKDTIKVMQVLDTYFPTFDGPTLLVSNYAKSMHKRDDMKVEVLVPKFPKYKDDAPFPVHRVKSMPAQENYRCALPMFDRKAKKLLKNKEEPFDIVHAHSPFMLANHAINSARRKKVPTVITLHTRFHEDYERLLPFKFLRKFMIWYTMRAFKKAYRVICVSDGTVDTLHDYGYKGDATVIRNGTDLVYPKNAEELKQRVLKESGLEGKKNIFLSVGRIVENKRLDLALNATKILSDKGYEFTYVIVGSGSHEEKLKKRVEELGLTDKVVFTGKIMDRELLSGYYLISDLFIFPSTFDTASLAPLEAAALKLPTLMTKGCSTAETIVDDRNGFLAEDDYKAWADRIEQIISAPERLPEIRENAHKEVYRSWDDVVEELRGFYAKVIEDYALEQQEKNRKKTKKA